MKTKMYATKKCGTCKLEKPLSEFYKNKKGLYGLGSICKGCALLYNRERRKNHPEKVRNSQRAWVEKQGDEYKKKMAERERKRRARLGEKYRVSERERNVKRREERIKYNRKYYQDNADSLREYQRQWRKENPEERDEVKRRYRSRKLGLEATLTKDEWIDILNKYEHKCVYCGESGKLVKEHWIPASKGGGYTKENIVPSCPTCNSRKGDRDGNEFLAMIKEGVYES